LLGYSDKSQDELQAGYGNLEEALEETCMAKQAWLEFVPNCVEERWQGLQHDPHRNAKGVAKRACGLIYPTGQTGDA
jgi:hypothetical protein